MSSPTMPPRGARRARRRGERVRIPWGRFVFFSDPDGNRWAVQELPPATRVPELGHRAATSRAGVYARTRASDAASRPGAAGARPGRRSGRRRARPLLRQGRLALVRAARFSSAAGVAVDAQGRILVGATLDDGSLLRTRAAVLRLLPGRIARPVVRQRRRRDDCAAGAVRHLAGRGVRARRAGPHASSRARWTTTCPAVMRLLPDGSLDPAFASGGILIAQGRLRRSAGRLAVGRGRGLEHRRGGRRRRAPAVRHRASAGSRCGADRRRRHGPTRPSRPAGSCELPIAGVTFASTHAVAIDSSGRIVLGIWRATTPASPATSRPPSSGSPRQAAGRDVRERWPGVLGAAQGRAPVVSVTRTGAIVALGAWTARGGRHRVRRPAEAERSAGRDVRHRRRAGRTARRPTAGSPRLPGRPAALRATAA